MKQKFLGFALFCAFNYSGVTAAADTAAYLQLRSSDTEVESTHSGTQLELKIITMGNIPIDGKAGAFGFAALTDGGNNVLVTVTHLPIDDSSHEQLPSGFHNLFWI